MATTLQEISRFLSAEGLKHRTAEEASTVFTGFRTEHYVRPDGENHLALCIDVHDSEEQPGALVTIAAPFCYKSPRKHRGKLHRLFSMIEWKVPLVRFELDSNDGEIRVSVNIPLMNASLTPEQLMFSIGSLTHTVDRFDAMVRRVMEDGEIELSLDPEERFRALLAR